MTKRARAAVALAKRVATLSSPGSTSIILFRAQRHIRHEAEPGWQISYRGNPRRLGHLTEEIEAPGQRGDVAAA